MYETKILKTFSMRKLVGYRIRRQWWCKSKETRVCNSKRKCHNTIFSTLCSRAKYSTMTFSLANGLNIGL